MTTLSFKKRWLSLILCLSLLITLASSMVPTTVFAESTSLYETIITDDSGNQITKAIFPLGPRHTRATLATIPDVHIAGVINSLSGVPAFDWSYGCSATSAAMLFGYYDRTGYSNIYTGPTNGGVCPLDNSVWGHTTYPSVTCGECPINATHQGIDGRATTGHVDDYWIDLDATGPDPYVGHWAEHTPDCAGDYMGTNQWKYSNTDGSTSFYWYTSGNPLYDYTGCEPGDRDGCHGMRLFAESRGYTVLTNFTQMIKGQGSNPDLGFTFADFQAEIDAGRPVLIQVTGHTMIGYGYDTASNTIYIHDTWDYSDHTMPWGGTYSGLHHRAVTVIRLQASPPPTVTNAVGPSNITPTSARLNGNLISTGGENPTVHIYWGDNDGGTTAGSWDTDVSLGTRAAGTFYTDISSLSNGTTYYYRCYATNSGGGSWAPITSFFIAQNTQKLLGVDDTTSSGNNFDNYVSLCRFTAEASGTVTSVRVKCSGNGNVKVAIYADSSGSPGALLGAVNTSTPVSSGWNTISLPSPVSITSGTPYWLAVACDSSGVLYYRIGGGTQRYAAITFSSYTFPNPAGSGYSSNSNYVFSAAWGSVVITAPTVTNALGPSDITSSSARLNGELTSTGGENPTVHIYWGDDDAGTTPGSWDTDVSLGTLAAGTFYTDISSLSNGTTYYYRCYATNSGGGSWASSTSSFVARNTQKLLGADDTTTLTNHSSNYFQLTRWTAISSGTASQIKIKCGASGNIKVAIYADSSGNPAALLNAVNTSTPVSSGWNTISLPSPVSITSGTPYWLAINSDANCINYVSPAGSNVFFKATTYSGFSFPDPAGSSFSSYSGYTLSAAWGSVVITAPTVTNSVGPSNITSSSARLNGELTSTGGENPTVHIYWGDDDADTTPGSWDHDVDLGTLAAGTFYTDISSLSNGTTYYYRCYATNSGGEGWASSTASFVAETSQKLFGVDAGTSSSGSDFGNYVSICQFTAEASGSVSSILVKCAGSGNVKVAIYADNSDSPGSLLNVVNTSTPVQAGWNTISIPATAVTIGTKYWLAVACDASGVLYYRIGGGTQRYAAITFSTYNFPDPAGSGYSSNSNYVFSAAWGSVVITAPIVTNALGPSDITSSSARLNGELTSTGGENPTVHIYWGDDDAGTTPGSWDTDVNLGTLGAGTFYTDISSLSNGTTYYYRCYATNSGGEGWASSTSSFVARNTQKLLGADDTTTLTNHSSNYFQLTRWTAISSGTASQIKIKCGASGNIKVAIYADSLGSPRALLGAVNTSTPVSSGWNTISLSSPVSITLGIPYWLAINSDANCINYVSPAGSNVLFKTATYSGFSFPDPAGSGFSSYSGYTLSAAWGAVVITAPAVTNALGPSNITSSSARLNGELTSTGGENPTVHVYWGDNDGGVTPENWDHDVDLGIKDVGPFYTDISGLSNGTTYYYRCYAVNSGGSGWGSPTIFFIAQNTQKLFGADEVTTPTSHTASYFQLTRWTAIATGTASQIRIKCSKRGYIKVAIYADSSGSPGALLAAVNTLTQVAQGWNTISLPSPISITSGTSYWLGINSSTDCINYIASAGSSVLYRGAFWLTFTFPDPAGSGFSSYTGYTIAAAWGP